MKKTYFKKALSLALSMLMVLSVVNGLIAQANTQNSSVYTYKDSKQLFENPDNWLCGWTENGVMKGVDFSDGGYDVISNAVNLTTKESFLNERFVFNIDTKGYTGLSIIGLRVTNKTFVGVDAKCGYFINLNMIDKNIVLSKLNSDYSVGGGGVWPEVVTYKPMYDANIEKMKNGGVNVTAFAQTEGENVRIVVKLDGTEVFNYLDDGAYGTPITEAGSLTTQSVVYTDPATIDFKYTGVETPLFPTSNDDNYVDLYELLTLNGLTSSSTIDPSYTEIKLADGRTGISVGGYLQEPTWGMTLWSVPVYPTSKALKFMAYANGTDGHVWAGIGCQDYGQSYDPWSKVGYYVLITNSYVQLRKNTTGTDWETGSAVYWFSEHPQIDTAVPHIYELATRIENGQTYLFITLDGTKILEIATDAIESPGSVYFKKNSSSDILAAVPTVNFVPVAPTTKTEKYIDLYDTLTDSKLISSNDTRPNIIDFLNPDGSYSKKLYNGTIPNQTWGTTIWSSDTYTGSKIARFKAKTNGGSINFGINVNGLTSEASSFTGQWNLPGYYLNITNDYISITPNPNGILDEYNANASTYWAVANGLDMSVEHEYQFGTYVSNDVTYLYVMVDNTKILEKETPAITGDVRTLIEKTTYATLTTVNNFQKWIPYEVQFGNVNNDDIIDIKDLVRLKKYFAGNTFDINQDAADISLDDEITAADIVSLRKIILGI